MSHTPAPASPETGHGSARSTSEGHLTVGGVITLAEVAVPPGLAAPWDSDGLICGDPAKPVHSILLVVDPATAAINEAIDAGVNMIITYHPLHLRGTDHVVATDPKGRTVHRPTRTNIALLDVHTNLDTAHGGVADALAECVGFVSTAPLEPDPASPDQGTGRIGTLPQPITLWRSAEGVASALPDSVPDLLVDGDLNVIVERIAVSGGADDSLLQRARQAEADVFLAANLCHHPAPRHLEDGRPYLLCGTHWATEWVGPKPSTRRLTEDAHSRGASLTIQVFRTVTDPWALRLSTGTDRV